LNTTEKMKNQSELIARYTVWLKESKNEGETYKWEAINMFQQHWNVNEPNFKKMFLNCFKKRGNLFYQNSWGFIAKAVKAYPEDVRAMLARLYDETVLIEERIETFQKESEDLLSKLKDKLGRDNLNHQQDERTISVYLSMRYPEKYYLYKNSFYQAYCNLIGEEPASSGNRYLHYLRLAQEFKEQFVKKDIALMEMNKELNPDTSWDDTNLIVQNIFYTMLARQEIELRMEKYRPFIDAFERWYATSLHKQREDHYRDILTLKSLESLGKQEFIDFYFQFARDGGFIQSGGARTAPNFKKTLEANYDLMREFLLEPFFEDFDPIVWLGKIDQFKGLGQGLSTIYLHHIDKNRHCIVNNKSVEAYKKLGFDVKGKLTDQYLKIHEASRIMIDKFPSLKNFYKTDALTHFMLGEEEGMDLFEKLYDLVQYWVFQGNPTIYDVVGSLKAGALKTWSVSAHKTRIKEGDKVILWLTGEQSGCYALCKVASKVKKAKDNKIEDKFYKDKSKNVAHDQVDLDILLDMAGEPLLKHELLELPEFADFNAGNQGTNYTATREQYTKIQELYWEKRLISSLKAVGDRRKIEWFLTLAGKLVSEFDLYNEDARISFSTLKNESGRLAITIGQRYVIDLTNEGTAESPLAVFGMIAAVEHEEVFKAIPGFVRFGNYNNKKSEPASLYAHFDDRTLPNDDATLAAWLSASETELNRTVKSGFREHHNPLFFKAAIDADYRNELLNKIFQTESPMNIYPLNQIFFGPPGTGKTYNTSGEAIHIADPDFYEANKHDRPKLKERFRELLIKDWKNPQKGQISFCTFHQSFSYEDFIEGIKPVVEKQDESMEGETSLKYEIEAGIFKKMAERARYFASGEAKEDKQRISLTEEDFTSAQFYKISLGNISIPEDQAIYDYCIENNLISVGFMDAWDITGKSESELYDLALKNKLSKFEPQAISYFAHYLKQGNYVVIAKGRDKVRALGKVTGDYFHDPDAPINYTQFRKVEWIIKNADIPVEEIYQKAFSQQTIYKLNKDWINKEFFVHAPASVFAKELLNFVLIIDEINRGNISQIFGELITLIEDDKREGKPEQLEVTLPYSKEKFSVPANLHIIGTMNTADRSIEALDTALRRRFTFVEMAPKPELIRTVGKSKGVIDGLDLVELLATINERIEKLIDKDHQIGHSYFLEIQSFDDLKLAFKNKVIPLLEEYFYGDFGKIGLVLGSGFVIPKQKNDFGFADFKGFDDDMITDLKERKVFEITGSENWSVEDFKKIYQK
jgi:hypothetical protein